MQDGARASFRHAGLLALAAGALAPACNQDALSDDERAHLQLFKLPAGPPADASNAWGDELAAARLGKMLYFDPRYSGELRPPNVAGFNGSLGNVGDPKKIACASCHEPASGGADRRSLPNATSLGASYTIRNAPSVINAAYSPLWQFWDGRADSLWSQALSPPEGPSECNGSRLAVAHLLFDHYRAEYDAVFPDPLPEALATYDAYPENGKPGDAQFDTMTGDKKTLNGIYANFGKAIAAYERRLVSNAFQPSPFERFMAGDTIAMSPAAVRGARLFVGRAGCAECHRGPMFTDYTFHNIGVPQTGTYVPATDYGRSDGIAALSWSLNPNSPEWPQYDFSREGEFSDQKDGTHLAPLSSDAPADPTTRPKLPTDGQFKTPTLRNVSKTAPYMHNGAYQTLWDVVNHYNFGGATGPYSGDKDPALAPLLLTDAEMGDLVEFLRALDDGPVLDTYDFPEGLLVAPTLP